MKLKNKFFKNWVRIMLLSVFLCFGIAENVNAETDHCSQIFQENEVNFNSNTRAWLIETIQPQLDKIKDQYFKVPESSRFGLESLLGHRLFNRFSYNYIQTVEMILRDLLIDHQRDVVHNINGDVYYLISILSGIIARYQPKEFKENRILNSNEEVAYGLLDSVFRMLQSKIDDYPPGLSQQEKIVTFKLIIRPH